MASVVAGRAGSRASVVERGAVRDVAAPAEPELKEREAEFDEAVAAVPAVVASGADRLAVGLRTPP